MDETPFKLCGNIKVDQYIIVHDISQAIIVGSIGAVAIVVLFKIVEDIIIPFIQEKYNYIKDKFKNRRKRKSERYIKKNLMVQ